MVENNRGLGRHAESTHHTVGKSQCLNHQESARHQLPVIITAGNWGATRTPDLVGQGTRPDRIIGTATTNPNSDQAGSVAIGATRTLGELT